jgi:hypothetical protein
MKPQLLLYFFLTWAVMTKAQTIPQSINKTPTPKPQKAPQKVVVIQKPVYIVKNNDRDGDGLSDAIDECPDEKGSPKNNGCPEKNWKNQYDKVSEFYMRELCIVTLNGKKGYADRNGNIIIPIMYDDATWVGSDNIQEQRARVKLNEKYGAFNMKGEIVIPIMYANDFVYHEGLAAIKLDNKWGYLNIKGKTVVPIKYDDTWIFKEGLGRVKLNNKWGFVNETGEVVIPIKYDWAWIFYNGAVEVELNRKKFSIDKKGNCVKDCD